MLTDREMAVARATTPAQPNWTQTFLTLLGSHPAYKPVFGSSVPQCSYGISR